MNEEKKTGTEETANDAVRPVKKQNKYSDFIHNIIIGDVFSRESFFRILPFLVYLSVLAILYISNTYYAEKTYRQIEIIKVELKELRFQYISSKSDLMYLGKQTEIFKKAAPLGLKESTVPPFKIFYSKDSLNQSPEAEEDK